MTFLLNSITKNVSRVNLIFRKIISFRRIRSYPGSCYDNIPRLIINKKAFWVRPDLSTNILTRYNWN